MTQCVFGGRGGVGSDEYFSCHSTCTCVSFHLDK